MTTTQQREQVVRWILEAVNAGARRSRACAIVGITVRTLQRWKPKGAERVCEDQRPLAERLAPANKLSAEERRQVLDTCNQPQYASLPPSQIVPKLADQGIYLASESSFYRILHAANQLHRRGRAKAPQPSRAPSTHIAQAPNEVWTWDISYLPSTVTGRFFSCIWSKISIAATEWPGKCMKANPASTLRTCWKKPFGANSCIAKSLFCTATTAAR